MARPGPGIITCTLCHNGPRDGCRTARCLVKTLRRLHGIDDLVVLVRGPRRRDVTPIMLSRRIRGWRARGPEHFNEGAADFRASIAML